jgi:DNA invertase Pin-like site-specific DNA recombinase
MVPSPREFADQTFGIYPRVSSAAQATEDKVSLDAQIDACREYGESLGMVLDTKCVRKEAFTSTTTERPELKALLRDMIARNVGNLVIDRADRLTRQGMLAAAYLLTQFTEAGILLHVASYGLVVRDEMGVSMFLQMAFAAQQANSARIRALMQTKRAYALGGRYVSGNRAPYGFTKVIDATDARGHPIAFHFEADLRDINGHKLWEVRRDICRWYLAGVSVQHIAERLSAAHVPTSRRLAGQPHALEHWAPNTVRDFLHAPINEGIVTSFRTTWNWAPPDAKHPQRWKRIVRLASDKQIVIPNAVAPEAILLSHEDAERIRLRLRDGRKGSPRRAKRALTAAMLIGGMAKCGLSRLDDPSRICGATLRVNENGHRTWMGYVCSAHFRQPHRCAGQTIPIRLLDLIVWKEVIGHLTDPDRLEELARQQAELDTSDDPASHRAQLQRTRKALAADCDNLRDAIKHAPSPFVRAQLMADLAQLEPAIVEADERIAEAELLAQDYEHRRAILGNIDYQVRRHAQQLVRLDPNTPADIPIMRTICRSLGVQPTVTYEHGKPHVTVDFNLGAATGQPWFPPHLDGVMPTGVSEPDSR